MSRTAIKLTVFLMIVSFFTGCQSKSLTSAELTEKYKVSVDQMVEVWLYDSDTDLTAEWYLDIENSLNSYNQRVDAKNRFHVTVYRSTDLSMEQFQMKLQAALMSDDGPDLILSRNPNLFSNFDKLIDSGAFRSFDSIIAKWDKTEYYPQVIEGVRAADGQIYILPISYDPDVIVTTKAYLEQFQLTEEDFNDPYETFASLTAVWQQLSEYPEVSAERSVYYMTRYIPSVFSIGTEIRSETVMGLYEDLMQMASYRQYHTVPQGFQELERIANGTQVFSVIPLSNAMSYLKTVGEQEREQYVFLPMCNTDGRMSGTIGLYAMLPKQSDHEETIAAYLDLMLFSDEEISFAPFEQLWLTPRCMEWNEFNLDGVTKLSEYEMRLTLYTQFENDINFRILSLVEQNASESDWEELERSINIYLSE